MKNILPKNFDWQFYLENNPDLKDAGISSQSDAENHWLDHGFAEDRLYTKPRIINNSVVNCYHTNSSSGIGDFLRGSIFLAENYKDFNFDLSNHPISKYLYSRYNKKINQSEIVDVYEETVKQYGQTYSLQQLQQTLLSSIKASPYVCSMYSVLLYNKDRPIHLNFQNHTLPLELIDYFQHELCFHKKIKQYYQKINIIDYDVAHIRLGDFSILQDKLNINDDSILQQINYKKYSPKINKIIFDILKTGSDNDRTMIIMSDNDLFKKVFMDTVTRLDLQEQYQIIHEDSNHCSKQPGLLSHTEYTNDITDQQLFNIVLDLYILSRSRNIYSYSVYPWGSGFSYAIAKIYDIPLSINII